MTRRAPSPAALLAAITLLMPGPLGGQTRASWIEAGGFYHRVTNGFGDWRGAYARFATVGGRDVWYLDARAQEAFRDFGVYGAVANLHHFSGRFFTHAGLGAGTGEYVFPELRADLSVSLKLLADGSLVVTAGGTYVRSKDVYQGYQLTGVATTLNRFPSEEASALWREWLGRRWGMVLQGDWYHRPFYTRTGASVGFFHAW